jgi:hypothetical protein
MVSSLERLDFSSRISGVMKGLCGRDEQVTVLRGACLSTVAVRVVLKRSRYDSRDVAGDENKADERISFEKSSTFIER